MIITADEKLVYLQFGTSGLYCLEVVADASESADKAKLLHELESVDTCIARPSISPKVSDLRESLRQARANNEIGEWSDAKAPNEDDEQQRDLGEWIPRCGPNPGYYSNE